jgi:hypothetical protein
MTDSLHNKTKTLTQALGLERLLRGRYGKEKLAVLIVYALSALLTLTWALSSPPRALGNVIGAQIVPQRGSNVDERWYTIHNHSTRDWTNPRLLLNDRYLHRAPAPVPARGSLQLRTSDFRDLLYVPRALRGGALEGLLQNPNTAPTADPRLPPNTLQILTDQGAYTHQFDTDSLQHQPPPAQKKADE